jgi:hypothetical protein
MALSMEASESVSTELWPLYASLASEILVGIAVHRMVAFCYMATIYGEFCSL